MARCDRCQAPQCMFYFGLCDNCGLPSYLRNTKSNAKGYPDTRTPERIQQDMLERQQELGQPFDFYE